MPDLEDVSVLIPLYRSDRFYNIICDNVDAALSVGARVIVSDCHCLDDAVPKLRERYGLHTDFTAIESLDGLDWIHNINLLMAFVETDFFRIIPHDDSSDAAALFALREELRKDPEAILSFGPQFGEALDGTRLPGTDQINSRERVNDPAPWWPPDPAGVFFEDRYNGAFKGMIRTSLIRKHKLHIRRSPSGALSERAWLSALVLVGRFRFTPAGYLRKRMYPESTHRGWKFDTSERVEASRLIAGYIRDLVPCTTTRKYMIAELNRRLMERDCQSLSD